MMKYFYLMFGVVLLMSGCGTYDKSMPDQLQTEKVEIIKNILRHHNLAILPKFTNEQKIVAVTVTKGVGEKGHDGSGNERHLIAFPGVPDADGNYIEPTRDLGGRIYVFETVYTAFIEDKVIFLEKTVAEIGKPGRTQLVVEPQILRDIAGNFRGEVVENRVVLP